MPAIGTPGEWVCLLGLLLGLLAIDLLLLRFGRAGFRSALRASLAWTAVALLFGAWVDHRFGSRAAVEYLTAYLIERSLSFDNLFVFVVLFNALRVSEQDRPAMLRWGVLGALVARAALIVLGVTLIARMSWLLLAFGGFLVLTGGRLVLQRPPRARHGAPSPLLARIGRAVGSEADPGHRLRFWLLALLAIELTDLVFAIDSIPAVFGVTRSAYIAFSSNAFAVLGLRALYGLAAAAIARFQLLHYGIGAVLVFVGGTLLAAPWWEVPKAVSLAVVLFVLAAAIVASLRRSPRGASSPTEVDSGSIG